MDSEQVLMKEEVLAGLISKAFFAIDRETPSDEGTDYKSLYYGLFNGISLVLEHTSTYEQTVAALKYLQCKAEDAYIG
ncbi:MAG: hypothetical protein FWC62_03090 [Firmicutes bacterium]|nr:hypothetical protein [Bacillota bacterium]